MCSLLRTSQATERHALAHEAQDLLVLIIGASTPLGQIQLTRAPLAPQPTASTIVRVTFPRKGLRRKTREHYTEATKRSVDVSLYEL